MKIYVIRHGLTDMNKQKIVNCRDIEPLAPEGVAQAEAAAAKLPATITHIYASPLLRTQQTAALVNAKLQRPIITKVELTEIAMGTLAEGQAWTAVENGEELKSKHREIRFDYRQYGGESAEDLNTRLLTFLRQIHNKHQDGEALIVTHGGIIRALHLLHHGTPLIEDVPNAEVVEFDTEEMLSSS